MLGDLQVSVVVKILITFISLSNYIYSSLTLLNANTGSREPSLILYNKGVSKAASPFPSWNRRLSPNLLSCHCLSQGGQTHKPQLNNDSNLSHPVTVQFWRTKNKDIRYCTQRNRLMLICMWTSIRTVFTTTKWMMPLYMERPVATPFAPTY